MNAPKEVMEKLRKVVAEAGSQAAFCEQIGVSRPFVSMMLSGKKQIPDRVLNHLGFERIVTYRRIK